ncbi:hypothetical protein [Candidatus Electronema sp. PJ]|uniref:hypothetical protein n=1 Tax=Candidatus Electronema sp. PJ TaxID=3401572 RepID=UPI003AA89DC0
MAGELFEQGLLRFHCPAPLGADRELFLSMIKEMQQRPGDYAALSLAGIGGKEAESKDAIISAVRRQIAGKVGTEADDKERADILWQARLVLKLGEIVERQEEDIRQSLHRISLREKSLFQTLRDDQDLTSPLESNSATDSSRMRLRLKAWRNLLTFGQTLPASSIFVTADRDAFDLLTEASNAKSESVLELLLPAVVANGDFSAKRAAFRTAATDILVDLPSSFARNAWNILLEQHYPIAEHGRCRLALHFFDRTVCQQDSAGSDKGAVIGILEPQP